MFKDGKANPADSLPEKGQTSTETKPGTSTSPKVYPESEYLAAIEKTRSDTLAEAGRKYKPIEEENITLKSQLATNQTLIQGTEERIAKLQTEIDDLAADDPDRQKYVKKLRELEILEGKLKDDRTALESEKTTHTERIKKAEKVERDQTIKDVAATFDGISSEKLTTLCDKLNLTTKEQITAAAETLGTARAPAAPRVDSGKNDGGAPDTSKMSPSEKIRYGLAHPKK